MNSTILVIGYGSLLSGYGIMAERRGGGSRLIASDAFPVALHNARRGLAKPSTHGRYLAMDLEPADVRKPITARVVHGGDGALQSAVGALGLVFARKWAPLIARREEYREDKFVELIALADKAGRPLGEFLLTIAERTHFNLLEYRRELRAMLGYTSPGYIFHPVPLADGRVAVAAIGSGFEGSGDPAVRSKRNECGMDRLLSLAEALAVTTLNLDHAGQIGYFVECALGGCHGLRVSDLLAELELPRTHREELKSAMRVAYAGERELFLRATGLTADRYTKAFGAPSALMAALLTSLAIA
ncbi:MAG: hypothetical protein ACREQE_04560 [Candidatus Binataceae bacterium]